MDAICITSVGAWSRMGRSRDAFARRSITNKHGRLLIHLIELILRYVRRRLVRNRSEMFRPLCHPALDIQRVEGASRSRNPSSAAEPAPRPSLVAIIGRGGGRNDADRIDIQALSAANPVDELSVSRQLLLR
jgi:hypothetical protein